MQVGLPEVYLPGEFENPTFAVRMASRTRDHSLRFRNKKFEVHAVWIALTIDSFLPATGEDVASGGPLLRPEQRLERPDSRIRGSHVVEAFRAGRAE